MPAPLPMSAAAPVVEQVECVVGPEWAAALAGAGSTAHLQAALARPDLWLEAQLLEKLLYKNANQHRGAQHLQRLHEVRRLLGLLRSQQLDRRVGALHEALAAAQQLGSLPRGGVLLAYGGDQRRVPSHHAAARVLRMLATACQLIEQLAQAVQRASLQLLAQLAHSFFMPLCLTALAALARIQVLTGQLLLDAVRAYNTLAEVAALLPPLASDGGASAADAPAPTAEGGMQADAAGRGALPQLLQAQWRRGLPRLEPVPCPAGEGLAEQAAAACARYALHVVSGGLPAAPASAVVLEEQPAAAGAAAGALQRRSRQRGKQAGSAAPVLAVVEDRGVPISRDAFAAAAGKATGAARAAAGAAAAPEPAPAAAEASSALPLLGVVEDSTPEEDAAGTVASLMEGEARGHLYRRAAPGLGPLARQPGGAAKRPKAAAPGRSPASVLPALQPAPQGASLSAEETPREGEATAAQPAQAAVPHQAPAALAAAAGASTAAASAFRPAFVSVAAAAAPKPAFLSVAAPTAAAAVSEAASAAANRSTLAAPATTTAALKQADAVTTAGAGAAATRAAAGPAAQPAGLAALGGPARKRRRPSAATAAAEQHQQQQQPALAEPKSWEDWLQPLGSGAASGAAAGPQQQTQTGLARRQQGKRRSGR